MTTLEKHRQLALRPKAIALWPEHWKELPFVWNGAGGEITAWPCGCGTSFTEESEVDRHIEEKRKEKLA